MTTSDTPKVAIISGDGKTVSMDGIDHHVVHMDIFVKIGTLERENNALRVHLAEVARVNEILEQHVDDARHNEYEAQSQLAERDAALAVLINAMNRLKTHGDKSKIRQASSEGD